MSGNGSVDALMGHLSDVDKRRRLVVMQQKETEAKLALAAQEQKEIEREQRAMQEKESRLQAELDALAGEQRQVAVQLVAEMDRVRRSDAEEPLLFAHAEQRLAALEADRATWAASRARLEGYVKAWHNDPCAALLREGIATMENEISESIRACAVLERRTVELRGEMARLEQVRATAPRTRDGEAGDTGTGRVRGPPEGDERSACASDDARVLTALQALRERLQHEREVWAHAKGELERQSASVRREVEDLSTRVDDMGAMLSDVQSSSWTLANNTELLRRCLREGRCRQCLSNAR